jgi:tetratricopeptide (TPR) repeat protein
MLQSRLRRTIAGPAVIDNASSAAEIRNAIPVTGNGHVIITSRNHEIGQFGAVTSIDTFDEATGVAYLLIRAPEAGGAETASQLAAELGGLPLALAQAGAYCAAGTSFAQYLTLLRDLTTSDLFTDSGVFYEQRITATWRISINKASAQAPLASKIMGLAARLGPDAIPVEFFSALLNDPADARQKKDLLDGLAALHSLSLVTIGDGLVSVHRLVQRVVRDEALTNGDDSGLISAIRALTAALPDDAVVPGPLPQATDLAGHVLAVARAPEARGHGNDVLDLLHRSCNALLGMGRWRAALEVALEGVGRADQWSDTNVTARLALLADLGAAYWRTGRVDEAIMVEEDLLSVCVRRLGPGDRNTLTARGNLAMSYRSAGRLDEAVALLEGVLTERRKSAGPGDLSTLTASANLASTYRDLGRVDAAIALEEEALTEFRDLLGPDHPHTITAANNLAASYWSAGRTTEAINLLESLLSNALEILGADHPMSSTMRNNLASSYLAAGRAAEARRLFEIAVSTDERMLGRDHPSTIGALGNLAISHLEAGDALQAIAILETTVADASRAIGPTHLAVLTARSALAKAFTTAGQQQSAAGVLRSLHADLTRLFGSSDPRTQRAAAALASFDGSS